MTRVRSTGVRRGVALVGTQRAATCAAAALVCALATVALAACAPAPTEAAEAVAAVATDLSEGIEVAHEERNDVRITDLAIAGPATNGVPAGVNRLGSGTVPVRVYEPASPWATLVWAHGGSFVHGTLDWPEADWVARGFADRGIRVVSVDYVLASETVKAPAPANDVAAALAWAAAEYSGPIVSGGASAGAHLAVLATLAQRDHAGQRPAALILEYPTLHRVQRPDAALAAAAESLPEQRRFRADRITDMYTFHLGDVATDATGLVAGELPAAQLALLPPTIIVNADTDELRPSGEEFAEQLRAAGVSVMISTQPGTVHGYLNRPSESARATADANATLDRFTEGLRAILG